MKKFTLFIMMLVMCATTTFAQTAITAPEDIKAGKIYWFDCGWLNAYADRTSLYFPSGSDSEADKQQLWSAYVWSGAVNNAEDPNQQYAFVEYDGKFYLYSVGADKFVTRKNDGAWLVEIPNSFVAITNNTFGNVNFPWNIAFDGTYCIAGYPYDGYEYSGYLYASITESDWEVAAWQIYEVGDLANAEELTTRLATAMTEGKKLQEEAFDKLLETYEEAENLLGDINYQSSGGGKIELQVADENAGNYIWCNEPELSEGPIEQLIDGIIEDGNFFHSRWNDPAESVHWLQVDLETELQNFSFEYSTRSPNIGNDFPDVIEVQGSNDGNNFETITILDNDLPQQSGKKYESGNIKAEKAYKHLRFVITAERIYFHMSEFTLYQSAYISVEDEAYAPYTDYLTQLYTLVEEARAYWEAQDPNATPDNINAYTEEINKLMKLINGLVTGADDEETVAYIAELEEILALDGVGYPGEAPRAAFKALVDAAKAKPTTQARLDLVEALADYIKTDDIILPTDGEKYTLTFVTYSGRRNFLNYETTEDGSYTLTMVRDTLTTEGLPLPETAVFTCVDNGDGSYDFMTADGKYLTTPGSGAASGSATGINETATYFTIVKMYPNGKCETDVTYNELFGLVALRNGSTYMAPNSSGSTFYTGDLPHFMSSWTSAMAIETWTPSEGEDTGIENVVVDGAVKGIYDLQGRKVENPSAGIYIIDGKKVLVK